MLLKENIIDKIIFLDVDGVLNSDEFSRWCVAHKEFMKEGGHHHISPWLVEKVIKICDETGASIVMSSSWRLWSVDQTLKNLASKRDLRPVLDRLVGITPRTDERYRGAEIKYFLDCCKNNYFYTKSGEQLSNGKYTFSKNPKYVIIDDDDDMLDEQLPFFVHTDFLVGITDDDVKEAIKILNNTDENK